MSDRFYTSKAWREVRAMVVSASGGVCARCGKVVGDSIIVHHKNWLKGDDYWIAAKSLDPSGLEAICHKCHNEEHDRFTNHKRVVIVYGSPFSGKSSYVQENMVPGDLIVDIDRIWESVTGLDPYDKPNGLRFNVFRIRDLLLDQVRTRYGYWRTAWVIGGYARSLEREELARKLQAEVVYIDSTREECLRRLEACTDKRSTKSTEWTKYINEWWDTYTPPQK